MMQTQELKLTRRWDKTFPKSDKVRHSKVTFVNRYGITLAADLYIPKGARGRLPAIAVSGPFGAVKEQCSGMAAVDYLSLHANVDPERIGILGICGWGGMALNAAALDTRVKATVASTMYDMTRVNANGYFDSQNSEEARFAAKQALCAQRIEDYRNGSYKLAGGVVDPLPEDAPFFVKDYYDYYKTPRGYHKRSLNSNGGWNVVGCMSFINQPILKYSGEIRSAVLLVHGENAHSCYFSQDAYADMVRNGRFTDNKELLILPGCVHTDLYDGGGKDAIPFDKMDAFFAEYLK